MGLRGRLASFFVAITVVPLTVAVVVLQVQIDRQLRNRAAAEIASVQAAAAALLELRRDRAGDLASELVTPDLGPLLDRRDEPAAQRWLDGRLRADLRERADLVVLVASGGAPLAASVTPGAFAPGVTPPDPAAIAHAAVRGEMPPGALLEVREVRGAGGDRPQQRLGLVVTGLWLDAELLGELTGDVGGAILADGRVLASQGAPPSAVPAKALPSAGEVATLRITGRESVVTTALLAPGEGGDRGAMLALWAPASPGGGGWLALALLVPSVFVAALLGWLLAGAVLAPVRRAAEVARAVAAGDLSQTLEPSGGKEVRDLALALNTMSAELAARLEEVERSRDQLRQSLSRLGQTLSSSLDLNRTLAVVVETAMDTLGADRAVLMLHTPERDALYAKVGRGVGFTPQRLRVGEGLAGWVAETGTAVRLPADAERVPQPVPGELDGAQVLAVPLLGRGQVIGVLSLAREEAEPAYSADDLATIRSFGAQASVAIENVMLHQEAQRLSVTDPLTGLWNFRYFQLQADRELESAARFDRPLSLVIVDIDHFKDVNDRYGHQVGDEVLIEVARRIRDSTRVPDVVARYGGEEFVVLLPGTDTAGATATATRIHRAVRGNLIRLSSHSGLPDLRITCSAGVATFPDHAQTVAGLLRNADAAMYTAKTQGRDRVVSAGTSGIVILGRDREAGG